MINCFTDKKEIDSYRMWNYLTANPLYEVTTVLDVKQQINIGVILNTDCLITIQKNEPRMSLFDLCSVSSFSL